MTRRGVRSVFVAVSAVALGACTASATPSPQPTTGGSTGAPSSAPTAAPTAAAKTKVNLRLSFKAHGHNAPYFLALDKGYFADEGLEVEIGESGGGGTVVQQLAAGNDTFGLANSDAFLALVAQGAPIKSVMLVYQKNPYTWTMRADRNVQTPKDLIGKKLGVTPGTSGQYFFNAFMAVNGIDATKVTQVSLDSGARNTAMLNSQVDGIGSFVDDSTVRLAEQVQVTNLLFYDWGIKTVGESLITNAKTIANSPNVVKGFVRAAQKGWVYSMAHPDEAADALIKHYAEGNDKAVVLKELAATFPLDTSALTEAKGFGYANPADWETSIKTYFGAGFLKTIVPTESVFTNEFIPAP
jgi:NitT/TauT family transport system substrate-binding protein